MRSSTLQIDTSWRPASHACWVESAHGSSGQQIWQLPWTVRIPAYHKALMCSLPLEPTACSVYKLSCLLQSSLPLEDVGTSWLPNVATATKELIVLAPVLKCWHWPIIFGFAAE